MSEAVNELEVTQRIALDLCQPVADLPKRPDGRGHSDRATDMACVMESGT